MQVFGLNFSNSGAMAPIKLSSRWRAILIVIGVLLCIRLALPFLLLHVANDRLARVPGYHGHIADLDLAIIRGAYRIEGFELNKVDSTTNEQTPFLSAAAIDLSVEWRALFHGALVGEVEAMQPMLRFTQDRAEPTEVQGDTATLGEVLNDFMPLRINRFALDNGRVEYLDEGSSPQVHLVMSSVNAVALNLRSVRDSKDLLPAQVRASAAVYGGDLSLRMGLDPLSEQSIWDLDLTVEGVDLTQVNDFFQAYADFDVNRGRMSIYSELATRDGAFKGYFKPLIEDLDVLGREDRQDSFFRKVWEGLVGGVGSLLRNPREENLGTKIPLEGRLDDPQVRTWVAVINVLRNAFIQAFAPAIDRDVDIFNVREGRP